MGWENRHLLPGSYFLGGLFVFSYIITPFAQLPSFWPVVRSSHASTADSSHGHAPSRRRYTRSESMSAAEADGSCTVCGGDSCQRHRGDLDPVTIQPWLGLLIHERVDKALEVRNLSSDNEHDPGTYLRSGARGLDIVWFPVFRLSLKGVIGKWRWKLSASVIALMHLLIFFFRSQEIGELLLRDSVHPWLKDISVDEDFVDELRSVLRHVAAAVFRRVTKTDWSPFILTDLIREGVRHVHYFLEARAKSNNASASFPSASDGAIGAGAQTPIFINSATRDVQLTALSCLGSYMHVAGWLYVIWTLICCLLSCLSERLCLYSK